MKHLILTTIVAFPATVFAASATVSVTELTTAGANMTTGMQNAVAETYMPNDGNNLLAIRNAGDSAVTATFRSKTSVVKDGFGTILLSDVTGTVPSGTTVLFGPFPTGRWNGTDGNLHTTLSTATGVSATAVRVK